MAKYSYDVAVVAAGPAGLAAAIAAAEGGVSVAVFEKGALTGGAMNMGMGPFAVESRLQKQVMDDFTKEQAFREYMDLNCWNIDAQIVHDYFWRSADTIDWLEDMGVHFVAAMKNFPASHATWHVVMPDDGSPVGARAASSMGRRMTERAKELGVDVYVNSPVQSLIADDGAVVGLTVLDTNTGERYDVDAKAVIIATGGFGSDPKLMSDECGFTAGKDIFTFMIPGIVGDGVRMAWEVGAKHGRMMMEKIIGHGLPGAMQGANFQFLCFTQGSPIAINKQGRRVCDESVMQNTAIGANIIEYQQDRTVYRILDDKAIEYFRRHGVDFPSEVFPGDCTANFDAEWQRISAENPEWAWWGDTIEELAERMGVDADNLSETMERYNALCDVGFDDDFGKDHRYLRKLDGNRYYGYRLTLSAYGSLGGIHVNPNYEVEDEAGNPIPGLYAAGNDSCEIYNGTYTFYFPGNSMGYAINSGRFAGENAAAKIAESADFGGEDWD